MTTERIAVLVDHTVADFATWKAAFDGHADARKEATVVAEHVNRGLDNPDRVIVYLEFTDRAKADAFLAAADMRETMENAGVTSAPTITFCELKDASPILDRELPAFIVRHKVSDYDAWREVYDEVAELRRDRGIIGEGVNLAGDEVIVYHQAESRDELEALLANSKLKDAMARAGVLEPPRVTFVTGGVR